MNYIVAILVLAAWIYVSLSFSWDPKTGILANIIVGLGCVLLLGLVYWVPFWLIFMK